MKYLDCVRAIAEKEKYAKCGVHKCMQGVVWDGGCRSGEYSVYYTQRGEKPDIAEIPIEENDLERIPVMHAVINEFIKAEFEKNGCCSENSVPEYRDRIEVAVQKWEYSKFGINKGMRGWICPDRYEGVSWLVRFSGRGDRSTVEIPIREEDMVFLPNSIDEE